MQNIHMSINMNMTINIEYRVHPYVRSIITLHSPRRINERIPSESRCDEGKGRGTRVRGGAHFQAFKPAHGSTADEEDG
jgi:hypothetical protein